MKKNKVYVNKINKRINNNQDSCEVIKDDLIIEDISVNDKLNNLFNTNGYIFNKEVNIITDNKTYNTRIAGKVNNHIITLDNNVIDIRDIKDIKY